MRKIQFRRELQLELCNIAFLSLSVAVVAVFALNIRKGCRHKNTLATD